MLWHQFNQLKQQQHTQQLKQLLKQQLKQQLMQQHKQQHKLHRLIGPIPPILWLSRKLFIQCNLDTPATQHPLQRPTQRCR
mmetsp:Transcript_97387/g.173456  ORF Transcript_97387/g.173456 Transcript_97387/m.173456 type:complete len:81 (+) Transcript_97387:521-763(+)